MLYECNTTHVTLGPSIRSLARSGGRLARRGAGPAQHSEDRPAFNGRAAKSVATSKGAFGEDPRFHVASASRRRPRVAAAGRVRVRSRAGDVVLSLLTRALDSRRSPRCSPPSPEHALGAIPQSLIDNTCLMAGIHYSTIVSLAPTKVLSPGVHSTCHGPSWAISDY